MHLGTTASLRRVEREDGVARNERLTGTTAVVLVLLLAAEGVTILFIRPLLSWHVFVGMLLIPPVALKLGTTGYRLLRYYGRSPAYVRRGPPSLFLRALAPLVVAATVGVFASGVALLAVGPRRGQGLLLGAHKASFVVWLGATALHVLAHVRRLPRLVLGPGVRTRVAVVGTMVALGAVLAGGTLSLAGPWHHWVDRDDAAAAHFSVSR
jgi:hypothetical protein